MKKNWLTNDRILKVMGLALAIMTWFFINNTLMKQMP